MLEDKLIEIEENYIKELKKHITDAYIMDSDTDKLKRKIIKCEKRIDKLNR